MSPSEAAQRPHTTWAWQQLRNKRKAQGKATNEGCSLCGRPIDYELSGNARWGPTVEHPEVLAFGGDLLPPLENLTMAHRACQGRQGQRVVTAMRRNGIPTNSPKNNTQRDDAAIRILRGGPPSPRNRVSEPSLQHVPATRAELVASWAVTDGYPPIPGDQGRFAHWGVVPWLEDLFPLPESASWPTAMSAPHPDAVGSFGPDAEVWLEENVLESGRPLVLRWWQRLAIRRQLEHNEAGELCWRQIVETTPRRSGKSVRLRAVALWRIHRAEEFGESQLVLLTGKDVPIVREIMLKAWPWAKARGYQVRQANGQEEIEHPDGSRWIIRSRESVYGYDVTMGLVDEAHGVPSVVVDDGLEPSLLERVQPQLVMTSTAHRLAKPLMRNRLAAAAKQVGAPRRTLLLQWSAPPGADVSDRESWRLASPHWSEEREEMIADVLERALVGESEEQEDGEPDPIEALRAQYLNIWPGVRRRASEWLPADVVARCGSQLVAVLAPERVASVESSIDRRRWSAAVSDGEHVAVGMGFSRLVEAVSWAQQYEPAELVVHGVVAELLDPNLVTPVHPITAGESCAATALLADSVRQSAVGWEVFNGKAEELLVQFGHVVTAPTVGGPRIAPRLSRGPVEAVVAVGWAHWRAVQGRPEPSAVF